MHLLFDAFETKTINFNSFEHWMLHCGSNILHAEYILVVGG
jgi:hypothetical protein